MLLSPISNMLMTAIAFAMFFLAIPTFAQDNKDVLHPDCTASEICAKTAH